MQYKIFVIPIKSISETEEELNRFLRGRRILSIQKEFVAERENSFWTFLIEYLEQAPIPTQNGDAKSKIDYKQVLTEDEFALFSRLRDLRKELAARESIPVYAIFTNEQLSEMAKKKVRTKADLQKIAGVGEAKITKYGGALIENIGQWMKTRPAEPALTEPPFKENV